MAHYWGAAYMIKDIRWGTRRRFSAEDKIRIVLEGLCADDATATLDLALASAGRDHAAVARRPRLLTDNGASYISEDLAKWLEKKGMYHVRIAPYHPQTQGKIERWHQTLKNHILLESSYMPGDLDRHTFGGKEQKIWTSFDGFQTIRGVRLKVPEVLIPVLVRKILTRRLGMRSASEPSLVPPSGE